MTVTTSTPPTPTPSPSYGTAEGLSAFLSRVSSDDNLVELQARTVMNDWWLMKFYDGARGNVDVGCKMLEKTLQWRQEYNYAHLPQEDFSADYATGKLYYHRRSKPDPVTGETTPVLIWRIARHIADPKHSERTVRFIVWMMDKGIRDGTITSRITLLIDRTSSAQQNVEGVHFFRLLTSVLQTHFPEMLHRIVMFPTNWLLLGVWKLVKPFLDHEVVVKVRLVGQKDMGKAVDEVWDIKDCPRRYGGGAEDWTDEGKGSMVSLPGRSSTSLRENEKEDAATVLGLSSLKLDDGTSSAKDSAIGVDMTKSASSSSPTTTTHADPSPSTQLQQDERRKSGGWGVGGKMKKLIGS
ncbi:CRAL-TRIO domain-containing protein [Phlyctochytrium arcticum]|nr:CRAL-TRIO domain-containing protein [Phlyctochytrium arcticum]